ncbi:OmpA/MotB family protein [Abyssalbus ytuae]|uniref:OmpA family protein n=1 Tax=Abyssalbus ytuae TaxID=2926907 RepID=A0A9E7CU45_9FLAO|nr:OmpA family protein [Abyssalbus ytuae]UOB17607.1 OmpA family protein [Abyssalbus ytuae]
MKKTIPLFVASALLLSCVSKKKYVELEQQHGETVSELQKTKVEKEELEAKFAKIEARAAEYNAKINALTEENDAKLDVINGKTVMSNDTREKMRATLAKVDPSELAGAKTLEDSINLAISYNLKKSVTGSDMNDDDVDINVENTVVMISISDKMLFNSGSYVVSSKAGKILQKLADVINSEPSIEVMIEGHTDSRPINTGCLQDNWDLSVKRATSIARILQRKYKVDPAKLIAAGRSSYVPLVDNNTSSNRARNRRTKILILPNIDKFFALMASNE